MKWALRAKQAPWRIAYAVTIVALTLSASAQAASPPAELADLEIINRAAPGPYAPPAIVTFELTITNKGPSNADSVAVTDILPIGMSYVVADSDRRCASSNGTLITCDLGTLLTATSESVTIIASVAPIGAGSSFTNVATVASLTPDPTGDNNTASVTANVVASEAVAPQLPATL